MLDCAPSQAFELERLAALRKLNILDTQPEYGVDVLVQLACDIFETPIGLVSLVDKDRQWFKSKVGLTVCETPREYSFCAHAIQSEGIFIVEDASNDPRFHDNPLVTNDPYIRFYMGAPLLTDDGYPIGTLCVIDSQPRHAPDERAQNQLRRLADLLMNQVNVSRSVGFVNPITGLPNRFKLIDDLKTLPELSRDKEQVHTIIAVDTCEPRQFSNLIQTLGHAYSDSYIVASANLLRTITPSSLTLYHLDVFRFAWLVPDGSQCDISRITSLILSSLDVPLICGKLPLRMDSAIGIAKYPVDADNGIDLVRSAVSAVHEARQKGVKISLYNAQRDARQKRSFGLLSDLGQLLNSDSQELALWYQPKVDMDSGKCLGAEALLRWIHPKFGFIPPDEFIGIVERTALMGRLTGWVLEQALLQLRQWLAAGIDLRLSINVSINDVADPNFAHRITKALNTTCVPAKYLELEITETAFMANLDNAIEQINKIKATGVCIAIDDFGTGHSSISYLKYITADVVKVDKLFIRSIESDEKDQILVQSIIDLSNKLGFDLVAEGVETESGKNWLLEHGCKTGQGYLMARPMPISDFEDWLKQQVVP